MEFDLELFNKKKSDYIYHKRLFQEIIMKRTFSQLTDDKKITPEVYFKNGKFKRHEIRVIYNGERKAAKVKIKGEVVSACLTKGGEFRSYTVTVKTDALRIKNVCDSAMRLAFRDSKVFKPIKRTTEEEFVKGASHSVLKGGIFLKRKYYSHNGKNSEPSFYKPNNERIYPKSIGPKSVIELEFKFESYCVEGNYGLRGVLEKNIIVHKLFQNALDEIPYII
jgi:hypothetical protein